MTRLALSEIAKRLNLHTETFKRWIKQGKIPVTKSGNFGIFNEAELNKWAAQQRSSFRTAGPDEKEENCFVSCPLLSAVKEGGLFKNIEGRNKDDVIRSSVSRLSGIPNNLKSEIYEQIIKREKLSSTGIGKGVAVPHPRSPLKQGLSYPMITTCFPDKPIDFDSIDGKPVFVFFLILTPSIEVHLNLLSKLSFCLRDSTFINFLESGPGFEIFLDRIKTMERCME